QAEDGIRDGHVTGVQTCALPISGNSGWDLSMNTSSSAMGISENNIIAGTGVHNGETHAYAMVPATPTPSPTPTATPTATPRVTPRPRPTAHTRPTPSH